MKIRSTLVLVVGIGLAIVASRADAEILFQDDFEGHTDVATSWNDGLDHDPGAPPIGDSWSVNETTQWYVQVMQNPATGTMTTPYGDQFLHLHRGVSGTSEIYAKISAADQAVMAAYGNLRIEFDAKHTVGLFGFTGSDQWPVVDTSASIGLMTNAIGGDDKFVYYRPPGGFLEPLSEALQQGVWQHYAIDINFVTDRQSIRIDGVTVSNLELYADLDKIQSVELFAGDWGGAEGFIGIDNLTLSSVSEEPFPPGDANRDGKVTDADAAILATNWQQCDVGWAEGDFNDDGCVTDADAAILATHWQQGVEGAAAPVPEPSTLVLLGMGLVGLLAYIVRRRR